MTVNWMTFDGPTFTLDIPSNWLIKANLQFQAMFIADKDENETIFPSLTIALIETDQTLTAYFDLIEQLQAQDYGQYTVIDRIREDTYCHRVYRWKIASTPELLWQEQRFLMNDKPVVYTLTATYLPSQKDRFAPLFKTMIDSFSFK